MIGPEMKKLIVDLDGTITLGDSNNYREVSPNLTLIECLREYKAIGFEIVISTARNMRTYEGIVGKINIHTLPTIVEWLDKHEVPYDEIIVGKPWCGFDGFYIDDKSIRPSEFASMSYDEIMQLLAKENAHTDSGNEL
jgi:capsule biosynthesis phosphatase